MLLNCPTLVLLVGYFFTNQPESEPSLHNFALNLE
jgi:hypothetical protein